MKRLTINIKELFDKYYPEGKKNSEEAKLRRLLLKHSRDVADKALRIVDAHPELHLDRQFVEDGALLHDIGIFLTDAPGIHCHGTRPYIEHGRAGGEILRNEGYEALARVCERHTGTGLPGYEPETMEEQVICYADKFFSKSHPDRVRTVEQTAQSLRKFGEEGVEKFMKWAKMFENEC